MWHDTFLPSWMSFSFSAVLTSDRKLLKHSIFSSAGVRRWGLWSRLRPRPSKRLVPTRVPSSPANSVPSTPSPPWLGRVSFLSLRKCQASQELFCYQDVFVRWMPNVTHCHTWHDWLKGCLKASPVEPWRIHNHDIYKKKKKNLHWDVLIDSFFPSVTKACLLCWCSLWTCPLSKGFLQVWWGEHAFVTSGILAKGHA